MNDVDNGDSSSCRTAGLQARSWLGARHSSGAIFFDVVEDAQLELRAPSKDEALGHPCLCWPLS